MGGSFPTAYLIKRRKNIAKINVIFNDTNYSFDETVVSPIIDDFKEYLTSSMSGTGAVIKLDDFSYNVDATKLSNATNAFISYLGTVAGNGIKVIVNGVEYGVDSNKMSTAVSELETVFGNLSGSGDEPVMKAAGLYQTGTDTMTKSWEELLSEGVVHVDNAVVYTNMDLGAFVNSSADILIGDLVLPNDGSIISFGENAFGGCHSLTSIIIPDSVTSIGYWAFAGCGSLTSVVIGDNVTKIDGYAFYGCNSLTDIYYTGTEEHWNAIVIDRDNEPLTNATIHYNYVG